MSIKNNDVDENYVKHKTDITELFRGARLKETYVKVCAPMVRYSRLEFRTLVRRYDVDLCFTPMIMADSFCRSEKARQIEFSSSTADSPVIAQFAAKNTADYLSAAEMVYPYVDGIDLNCGCPQRWAIATGYGCALLNEPELIRDLTTAIKRNVSDKFSVSVKLRVQHPLSRTIDLCRQLEMCGVNFLTVHGRTPTQKIGEPSNPDYLAEIKQSIRIPLIANGDVKSLTGANELYEHTQCDGVMSARGILSNPTLFRGEPVTPLYCIQDWINLAYEAGDNLTFQNFHHHLSFMMEKMMRRRQRICFNNFTKKQQVFDFLAEHYEIVPQSIRLGDKNAFNYQPLAAYNYDETKHRQRVKEEQIIIKNLEYNSELSKGKYFQATLIDDDELDEHEGDNNGLDYMNASLFDT